MQVVHGEKVVQETGGRLSMPQRVGLRHLKQLGHTFTRSEAVGAQYYNSAKSEKVVARSETGKAHHYTFTRSETVGAQNYTSTRSETVEEQNYTSTRFETVGAQPTYFYKIRS